MKFIPLLILLFVSCVTVYAGQPENQDLPINDILKKARIFSKVHVRNDQNYYMIFVRSESKIKKSNIDSWLEIDGKIISKLELYENPITDKVDERSKYDWVLYINSDVVYSDKVVIKHNQKKGELQLYVGIFYSTKKGISKY